jgi:hypothetical protein
VVVDGNALSMTAEKVVNKDTTIYEATTTLSPGANTYYFDFSAGGQSWQMPYNNVTYNGPIVAPFDLTNITVKSPGNINGVGEVGRPLTFQVVYTSPSGKQPTVADVVIDGVPYPMTDIKGNPTSGITYQYTTSTESQGDHYFQFEFNDGTGLQDFQEYPYSISSIVLQHSQVSPTSGTTSTPFTFSTIYYGPDTPTQIDVVVDGQPYPLTYVSGSPATGATYSTQMTLAAGKHTFAFYAADSSDSWSAPESPGVFKGLTVTANGKPLIRTKITSPQAETNPYPNDDS